MLNRSLRVSPALVLAFLLAPSWEARAQVEAPGFHVVPGHTGREWGSRTIPDGQGGALVSFKSLPGLHYLVRIAPTGAPEPGWGASSFGGINVLDTSPQVPVSFAMADVGKAWVISDWGGDAARLLRKIDAGGLDIPDSSGYSGLFYGPGTSVSEPGGRVLFFGKVSNIDAPGVIRCGVLDPDGSLLEGGRDFAVGQILIANNSPPLQAVPDGQGGAYVVANPQHSSYATPDDYDVYAVRVNADGHASWTPPARALGMTPRDQTEPSICLDGGNGAFFSWSDKRDPTKASDIYATHLLADGSPAPGWPGLGKAIASFPGAQYRSRIVEDGTGGFWCVWIDSRSGEDDVYFTHMSSDGDPKPGFPVGGIPLCAAPGNQNQEDVVSDGAGGFFAAWVDGRDGTGSVYAQHIHSTGVVMPGWQEGGSLLSTPPAQPSEPQLALTSPNHAIVTWTDDRSGDGQVYSLGLPEDGPVAGVSPAPRGSLAIALQANPARGALSLWLTSSGTGPVRVTVHDLAGRVLAEKPLDGSLREQPVNLTSGLRPGLYFVRAAQNGASVTRRVSVLE
jgi:hypothetical protein